MMKPKTILFLSSLLFVIFLMFLEFSSNFDFIVGSSLPVCNLNTGLEYASIQEAINADETLDGHSIQVNPGTYYEHIVVNKSLSLFGVDQTLTLLDGQGNGTVINVTAPNVNINNFTIQNGGNHTGNYGIHVNSHPDCTLQRNILLNNSIGILINSSSKCKLYDNYMCNNTECGIYLNYSDNCDIGFNEANYSLYGLHVRYSTNCSIYGNKVSNNTYGILLDNSQGCLVGVLFSTPQGYRIFTNKAFYNEYGICVANCEDCDIAYMNTAENNTYGIYLTSCKRCLVGASRNGSKLIEEERSLMPNFVENNEYGIYVEHSEDCQIDLNYIEKNRYGVWIDGSQNCTIKVVADDNTLGTSA